jgi:beta-hydroxylase
MAKPSRPRWLRRLRRAFKTAVHRIGDFQARHGTVPDAPVLDAQLFPWISALEAETATVQRELEAVLARREDLPTIGELQRDQYSLSVTKWKAFILYGWGFEASEGSRLCPETSKLVAKIPGLRTAFFSILEPGAHIPEHRGLVRGLLRGHLALIVPKDGERCTLWVDHRPQHWQEGKVIVFDDTYLHEVRNDTPEYRVVLLLHFDRPMSWYAHLLHAITMFVIRQTSFVRSARRDYAAWAGRFRAQQG